MLTRLSYATIAIGIVVTLWFMLRAGTGNSVGQWLLAIPFAVWVAVPYAIAGVAVRWLRGSPRSQAVLLFTAIVLTSTAIFLLYQSFVASGVDAQSALVFVFLPLWQVIGLAPFLFVAFLLRRRNNGSRPRLQE